MDSLFLGDNFVLPNRYGYMDKYLKYEINELIRLHDKPIIAAIYDSNGTVLASTDYNAELIGVSPQQLCGMNIHTITNEQILLLMPDIESHDIMLIKDSLVMFSQIIQIVNIEQIAISYINFMPLGGIRKPFIEIATPIFGESLAVVGIKIVATEYSFYGQNEYFKQLCQPQELSSSHVITHRAHCTNIDVSVTLAERQLEIVYLLANGFTQSEVAQILHISRGSIANIVSEQICPKFNISGSNTKLLIDKAVALGLHFHMPPSLYKPFVIILDSSVVERYF